MTSETTRAARALALGVVLLILSAGAGSAQVARSLSELAELSGIEEGALREVGAERLLAKDVYERRGFLEEAAKEPRGDLLPLISTLARREDDWPLKLTCVKLLTLFALRADRDEVAAQVLPMLEENIAGGETQILRWSLEEVERLNRWFRFDTRLAPLLMRQFEGEDFNLRSLAYRGICDLRHPRLVEELVLPCSWKVYESTKVNMWDRRQAIRIFVYNDVREALPKLQRNLTRDGRVAVTSAWALGRMLDPSSLKELRKVDFRAVHSLRKLAWLARCRLNDKRCLHEVQRVVSNRNEHDEIKRVFVAMLGDMTEHGREVDKLLEAFARHPSPAVQLGAAMARLSRGDAGGVQLVVDTLKGPWPDDQTLGRRGKGWMRQLRFMDDILRIESPAANRALIAMIDVIPKEEDLYDEEGKEAWVEWWRHGARRTEKMSDWYDEYRADAVSLLGERRVEEALPRLTEVSKDKWGHIRTHALVSRIEIGDEKAIWALRWYLPRYDDAFYRDYRAIMGKTTIYAKRMKWSSVFDLCDKFERVADAGLYLPLLDELMRTEEPSDDPMAEGWIAKVDEAHGSGGTTMRRDPAGDPTLHPPEVAYRLRNQFARRRIVECAARIGAQEPKAVEILGRALRDCRATVRAAALTEIGRLSGLYDLPPGSGVEEERKVWLRAVGWVKGKGGWPE